MQAKKIPRLIERIHFNRNEVFCIVLLSYIINKVYPGVQQLRKKSTCIIYTNAVHVPLKLENYATHLKN
jgi:hypothetical protein